MGLVIAIDGPAGAGKSTVGRALAERMGLRYLDTGAMYRAMTFAMQQRGIPVGDLAAVAAEAAGVAIDIDTDLGTVVVDEIDATAAIRGREVTEDVSQVAANPGVREVLVARQREWAAEHDGGVIEGRDIGSVVFPDARLKLYITASPRVRAERRVQQVGGDVAEVEASIIVRDRFDSTREHSPLTEASGAVVVDTTGMSVEQVVDHIIDMLGQDA